MTALLERIRSCSDAQLRVFLRTSHALLDGLLDPPVASPHHREVTADGSTLPHRRPLQQRDTAPRHHPRVATLATVPGAVVSPQQRKIIPVASSPRLGEAVVSALSPAVSRTAMAPADFLQLLPTLPGRRYRVASAASSEAGSGPAIAAAPEIYQGTVGSPVLGGASRPSSQPASRQASRLPTPPSSRTSSRTSSRGASPRPGDAAQKRHEKAQDDKCVGRMSQSSAAAARSAARLAASAKPTLPPSATTLTEADPLSELLILEGPVNLNGTYQSGGYRSPIEDQDVGLTEALV